MAQIAIYGKGGIGKSTISANLSCALASMGYKILQIGCDPKHDSTRLLMGGEKIQTVLDYLKHTSPQKTTLEHILHTGVFGVHCIEAGGPEPGVGCAGRGILSTFEALNRWGLRLNDYDVVLYDVLGDVVCGGFAVPLRREYAKTVYIVTSGEFMSIYAANNILRGAKNYSKNVPRIGGILLNERGDFQEKERVERFADAVKLPILCSFPRSNVFLENEKRGKCVVEANPEHFLAQKFINLAKEVLHTKKKYPPQALDDSYLEEIILGRRQKIHQQVKKNLLAKKPRPEKKVFSKSLLCREPLHGCAYNGALSIAIQIRDSVVLSHGPRSCAHIAYQTMSSIGRRSLFEKGRVLPVQVHPPIASTDMSENTMIFGGTEELIEEVNQQKKKSPALISIVTTCPSGIIGDDIQAAVELEDEATKIISLESHGVLTGDFMQGMIEAYFAFAKALIDPSCCPQRDKVNVFGEKTIAKETEPNIRIFENWIHQFGLTLHTRYLLNTNIDRVQRIKEGGLNILAQKDFMGNLLKTHFETHYEMRFFPLAFPIGYDDSVTFIKALGDYCKKPEVAQSIIEKHKIDYQKVMENLKPILFGKKLFIVTYNHNIDWIIKTALDTGMIVKKIGVLNHSQDMNFNSRYEKEIGEIALDYTAKQRMEDFKNLKPDLFLSNYATPDVPRGVFADTIPLSPQMGFLSGLDLAKRWEMNFRHKLEEGWRNDHVYFEKYAPR